MTVSEKMQIEMQKLKMDESLLSLLSGVGQNAIRNILDSKTKPRSDVRAKLAAVLGCNPDDLVDDDTPLPDDFTPLSPPEPVKSSKPAKPAAKAAKKATPAKTAKPAAPAKTAKPAASAPIPEPVASAPIPEPVASAPIPEPAAPAPIPEPAASAPIPEPSAPTPTPEPAAPAPIPEPEPTYYLEVQWAGKSLTYDALREKALSIIDGEEDISLYFQPENQIVYYVSGNKLGSFPID